MVVYLIYIVILLFVGCSAESSDPIETPGCSPNGSSYLFESSFEEKKAFDNLFQEKADSNSIVLVTSPAKSGCYSTKFTLNKSDPDVAGSKRAEITLLPPEQKSEVERWFGFSVFLPPSFITDKSEESIFQIHTENSIPIAILSGNGRWKMVLRNIQGETAIDLGPYDKNVWTNWVLHIKFSSEVDGLIEVWKNGELVLTRTAPNILKESSGLYYKIGIYKWGWKEGETSTTTERIAYFDEVKIGTECSSYNKVAPR